jgi:hypothetical protein
MSDYTHEYLHEVYQTAVEKAAGTTKSSHYADEQETAPLVGLSSDDLREFLDFILQLTRTQISMAIEHGHIEDDDWNAICDTAVVNASATTMILKKALSEVEMKKNRKPSGSEYPTTLMAEAHIRRYIKDKADLNEIWPIDLAEEVAGEFEPHLAFMVGVVCGSSRG